MNKKISAMAALATACTPSVVGDWTLSEKLEVCEEETSSCSGFNSWDLSIATDYSGTATGEAFFEVDSPDYSYSGTFALAADLSVDKADASINITHNNMTVDGEASEGDDLVLSCTLDGAGALLTCEDTAEDAEFTAITFDRVAQ